MSLDELPDSKFIITMGPLHPEDFGSRRKSDFGSDCVPNTCGDFWQMCWGHDVKVEIDKDMLHICSSEDLATNTEDNYRLREFSKVPFKRSFTIPNTIDQNKVEANFIAGILVIKLSKKPELKAKTIHVK